MTQPIQRLVLLTAVATSTVPVGTRACAPALIDEKGAPAAALGHATAARREAIEISHVRRRTALHQGRALSAQARRRGSRLTATGRVRGQRP